MQLVINIKMRMLVTGGAGFIGTNLCFLAAEKGHQTTVLDNFSRKGLQSNLETLRKLKITLRKGDVREPIPTKLGRFDVIIHLAATCSTSLSLKGPYFDFLDNALGTLNVLEFARKNGQLPVIYASTCKVYTTEINTWPIQEKKTRYQFINGRGVSENGPLDAQAKFARSPYGASKYTGDLYCQEYWTTFGVPIVINRLSTIFGQYQQGSAESGWISWFITAKKKNLPVTVYGNGKQVRDCLWGEDAARLFLEQAENHKKHQGQIYNVGGGADNSLSILELVDYLNQKGNHRFKVKFDKSRPADFKVYISNLTKIKQHSSWKPKVRVFEGIDYLLAN